MVQRLHDNRITALYCRLSRDDGYADDSCSIDSQKSMLREYAINEGFDRCEFFVDDGFSGTNFDNHASGNGKKVDIYYRFVGKMSMRRRT